MHKLNNIFIGDCLIVMEGGERSRDVWSYNILRAVISHNTSVSETLIICRCLEDKLSTLEKTDYERVTKAILNHVILPQKEFII